MTPGEGAIGALEMAPIAVAMRQELWLYPIVEIVHISGFVVLVGSIAMLDLRLLGLSPRLSARELARHVLPWTMGALIVIVPTGLLMFIAHASDLISNRAFQLKLALIALAGLNAALFHTGAFRTVAQWDSGVAPPKPVKLHAAVSLVLWGGVLACGRLLAYVLTSRIGYTLGSLACVGLLAFAFYLQYVEHQEPCPLCILQRIAFCAMMAVFIIAALHGPARRGAVAYSTVIFLLAGIGGAVAGRQVWLQHLPANQVPACGPGLEYMLERFPLGEALRKIFAGSGECAEVGWRFLGFSIAEWSLLWFVVLAVFAVFVAMRAAYTGARTRRTA